MHGTFMRMVFMDIQFYAWDPSEGEVTEEKMREKMERFGFKATKYVYPPGTFFPPHTHPINKIDGVLSGTFEIKLEGQSFILKPGDMLFIPKFTIHSARVVGDEPVVSLDAQEQ